MKDEINNEDINKFKKYSNKFAILLIISILSAVPLFIYMGKVGCFISILLFGASMYYANKVEKYKKEFDIYTYKEIINLKKGKNISEIEKHKEHRKREYQEFLSFICVGIFALGICIIMTILLL